MFLQRRVDEPPTYGNIGSADFDGSSAGEREELPSEPWRRSRSCLIAFARSYRDELNAVERHAMMERAAWKRRAPNSS